MNHYNSEKEIWDLEIKPTASLFSFNLAEVWRYRDLMMLFVKRDFTAQYKQTVLGPLWHVIQPVFTTIIFLLVFNGFAGIKTDPIPPTLFYMSSLAIWNYFSICLTTTSSTFITNASIFGKVYFPRLVIPLSVIISNIFRFFIQFGLLIILMIYWAIFKNYSIPVSVSWLLIPFFVLLMGGISLGLGIIISSLTTKYRDFSILITFGVQLFMYITPVAYPLSFLSDKSYSWLITFNPLSPVMEGFRHIIFNTPDFNYYSILYSIGFMIVSLLFGIVFFNRVERSFMDTV